jgi:stearoyl-CoA desaturase (delta-9 desaturase)
VPAGTAFAFWLWLARGIGPPEGLLPWILAFLTGLGITVGFHRLITHRSFETFAPIRFILAVLGCMAGQSFFHWVAWHRQHHQHSDEPGDPHSPHAEGNAFSRASRFFHAHTGWFFWVKPDFERYIPDLLKDPVYTFVERTRDFWYLLGMAIPAVAAGVQMHSWQGVLLGFLWGGLVRIFVVDQITFSVNSVCHLWGSRPFQTDDTSRNNLFVGVLGLGEGWHNNHHAFPQSARQGLFWWQLDLSYAVIRFLEMLGLAWNVRRPTDQEMEKKRVLQATPPEDPKPA